MRTQSTDGRRNFLKQVAKMAAALSLSKAFTISAAAQAGSASGMRVSSASPWSKQIGLELFSVRDVMTDPKGYEATLEKVAAIGYKEVEAATGYAGLNPAIEADAKQFRAMLDRLGLSMPSSRSFATEGPDLEKQLERKRRSDRITELRQSPKLLLTRKDQHCKLTNCTRV